MFGPKSQGLFAFNTGWVQAFEISLVLQAVWKGDIPNGSGIANHCLDVKSHPCKTEKHGKFIHFYVLEKKVGYKEGDLFANIWRLVFT